jgi:hypothetical protein
VSIQFTAHQPQANRRQQERWHGTEQYNQVGAHAFSGMRYCVAKPDGDNGGKQQETAIPAAETAAIRYRRIRSASTRHQRKRPATRSVAKETVSASTAMMVRGSINIFYRAW